MLIASCFDGIECGARHLDSSDAKPFQLRQKLTPDHLDPLQQRIEATATGARASSARSRLSTTSRRSARISRRPRSMSFEISRRSRRRDSSNSARGLPVPRDVLLRDPILLGELPLELLDVGRLRGCDRSGAAAVVCRAPTSGDRRP